MLVSSFFKKKPGKETNIFSIQMKLANVLYIFPVKIISQQTETGFLNHGRIEWFLFSEFKASKTCQQTLTNIGAKEKFIQTEENQTLPCHWFTVFLLTKPSVR